MSSTPFHDLESAVGLPRTSGLTLSPDGSRLVVGVQTVDAEGASHVSGLWEIDPTGERPARELTSGLRGLDGATHLPDGTLLFTSTSADPGSRSESHDENARLWALPTGCTTASVVAARPGGIDSFRVARGSGLVVLASRTFPSSTSAESDRAIRQERAAGRVTATLHDALPVRFWDEDLAPDEPRLFAGVPGSDGSDGSDGSLTLKDLTPHAGPALTALRDQDFDVSPDGSTVATPWTVLERAGMRVGLAVIDVAAATSRLVLDDVGYEFGAPCFSPDGRRLAVTRQRRPTSSEPPDTRLAVLDVGTGDLQDVSGGWDHWPAGPVAWTPDGTALVVVADEDGRAPVFRVDLDGGVFTRLTHDDFAYSDVQVSPDGRHVYALRSSCAVPPHPVRLDAVTPDQRGAPLHAPHDPPALPGRLGEVETTTEDGVRLRAWLALPSTAGADDPAPLLLWIDGGPLGSWNAWSWRWDPWLPVARGYAVLMPDTSLSTGYGLDFVRRGWAAWGDHPYTDLMTITDAALARPDLDERRTAAMGGSFGGSLASWVAGHTDRFDAIVTHAGLWSLDRVGPTTDNPWRWTREWTPEMLLASSPHRSLAAIRTPMLVIHGGRDYRVPVTEALTLFAELAQQAGAVDGSMPHRFLSFPTENHWINGPRHLQIWYQTVLAFLDQHVLGQEWVTPPLLR